MTRTQMLLGATRTSSSRLLEMLPMSSICLAEETYSFADAIFKPPPTAILPLMECLFLWAVGPLCLASSALPPEVVLLVGLLVCRKCR